METAAAWTLTGMSERLVNCSRRVVIAKKLLDRRNQLKKLLRDPNLSPSDRQIVKDLLINIQNALSGY